MSFDTPNPPYNFADPHATYLNSSCLDFLLIELVPLAYRMAAEVAAQEEEYMNGGLKKTDTSAPDASSGAKKGKAERVVASVEIPVEDEEAREAVFHKLENMGYRVGLGIVERFSRDRPRFTDPLDMIKFLCKDLWILVFRKQIDNLKTNHRGIYVLTDNTFTPLKRMSLDRLRDTATQMAQAQPFLYFPAGVIRGALSAMGINATVEAETRELPGATFQIRTVGAKPRRARFGREKLFFSDEVVDDTLPRHPNHYTQRDEVKARVLTSGDGELEMYIDPKYLRG